MLVLLLVAQDQVVEQEALVVQVVVLQLKTQLNGIQVMVRQVRKVLVVVLVVLSGLVVQEMVPVEIRTVVEAVDNPDRGDLVAVAVAGLEVVEDKVESPGMVMVVVVDQDT
jgi:hypothetical protein